MKKRIGILFAIIFAFMFGIVQLKAISNDVSLTTTYNTTTKTSVDIELRGTLNSEKSYYVMFVKEGDSQPSVPANNSGVPKGFGTGGSDTIDLTKWFSASHYNNKWTVTIYDYFQMYEGYTGAYVIECDYSSCTMSSKIPYSHAELPELGERYTIYFYDDSFKTTSHFTAGTLSFNNTIKIGEVTSSEILNKFRNNSSDAYTSLLEYAKTAEGKEFIVPIDNDNVKVSGVTIKECTVYYLYIKNDTSNGKYKTVEEVQLAMGNNYGTNNTPFFTSNIDWESKYCGTGINGTDYIYTADDVKNPQTGDIKYVVIVTTILLIAAGAMFGVKKLKKITK